MKRAFLITALAVFLALCLSACGCRHEWQEATCETPKTCSVCGDAEGEPLPHTPGEWMLQGLDYLNAKDYLARKCTVCGAVLEEYTSKMESFHNEWVFFLSAEDFAERLTAKMQILQEDRGDYTAEIEADGGKAQLNIYCTDGRTRETVGELSFAVGGDELDYTRRSEEGAYLAVGGIAGGADHLAIIMPAMILTADPAMDIPGAFSLAEEWISCRSTECNGLLYEVAASSEAAVLLMIRIGS